MIQGTFRASLLALLTSLTGVACRSMGGSFLVLGSSPTPHEGLSECFQNAQDEASRAQEDFSAAFHVYQRLTEPQAVELASLSDDFADAVDDCKARAAELKERIEAANTEAERLFQGWTAELAQFSTETLRKKSEAQMKETAARSQRVIAALERSQSHMEPVLLKLQDCGLFFHHNLNARAIATLEDAFKDFDSEFSALNSDLDKAREEITAFLAAFQEREE